MSVTYILFQPLFNPESPYYWVYLVWGALIVLLVCSTRLRASGNRSVTAALREAFNPRVFFHPSAIIDYVFVFISHFISALAMVVAMISAEVIAHGGAAVLNYVIGPAFPREPGIAATLMFTVTVFVAADFAQFYFHFWQHRSAVLWELHKVHHSAEVLTPLTGLRVHPISDFLRTQFTAFCVGLPAADSLYYYGGAVARVNLVEFFWYFVLLNNLLHIHVWVMFPRGIREIFYSPALHLIHHSTRSNHRGKNLGFGLTIWDRLAGTLYQPGEKERDLVFGIGPDEMRDFKTVRQLFWTPMRNIIFGKRVLAPDPQ